MLDGPATDALAAAARIIGGEPDAFNAVRGGRNSRVYQVVRGAERYALKQYFRHAGDERDRLGTEFEALRFMHDASIACVARPIALSREPECAIYEWIDGSHVDSSEVSGADVGECVAFLSDLRALSQAGECRWAGDASEARFSIAAVLQNVSDRLDALRRAEPVGGVIEAFGHFFHRTLEPSYRCIADMATAGASADVALARSDRNLSPSDFGFHNSLRRVDGGLSFLDFEYFGWDDPAKTICDFVLHPAMRLSTGRKTEFVRGMLDTMEDIEGLPQRVATLYPVFTLKWTLILLNEFLPAHLARRAFSGSQESREELQRVQLAKAELLMGDLARTNYQMPYAVS